MQVLQLQLDELTVLADVNATTRSASAEACFNYAWVPYLKGRLGQHGFDRKHSQVYGMEVEMLKYFKIYTCSLVVDECY